MSPYKRVTVYFFTGTGNSENVASWIKETASRYNLPVDIFNIAEIDRLNVPTPASGSLIVFVSPVHGFNYPPVMLNFILRFPRGRNNILLMNTRAGMLIGKWITPGLTGIAFFFSAIVLRLKGYSIKGMIPVDMPSNWISVHPGLNKRTVKYLHFKNRERVIESSDKIISGGKNFKAIREILQDLLISPIAIGYYLAGRFIFAKTYYASGDCNNCGLCISNCPVKAIVITDKRPYWSFRCESCMRCMSNCSKRAIETAHGFIIAFSILFSTVVLKLVYSYTDLSSFNSLVTNIAELLLFLSLLSLSYRALHFCMRFRFVERIVVYTSLTKYKWWGRRYKALQKPSDYKNAF